MPQSWVCLITGIELNVLFVQFPADTRHQLCDERPLLPPAQHPTASCPDLPLERFLSLRGSSWGVSGHRESEGGLWTLISPIPARVLPKMGSRSPEDHGTMAGVMSGMHSMPGVGLWVHGGLCPSSSLLLHPLGPGWVEDGQGPLHLQVAAP